MFSSNATQVSAAAGPNYIEDVFSTYLYTGNGTTQAIGNNIALGNGATTAGWVNFIDSNANTACAADSSGNVYFAGRVTLGGSQAVLVSKYNSLGVIQWQRTLQRASGGITTAKSVTVDSSGNVYVCGDLYGPSNDKMFVAKYNSSGTIQWQNTLGNLTSTAVANGVALDGSGNVYIAGTDANTSAASITVAKYNNSGVLQWQRKLTDTTPAGGTGSGIAVSSAGNVYVSGFVNAGPYVSYVAKYNTSGTLQWQRRISNGVNQASAYGVALDSSENVYVICDANISAGTSYEICLLKYNSSGTLQWQRQFGKSSSSENPYGIAIDSSDNVYIAAGTTSSPVVKYNSSGTLQWQRRMTVAGTVPGPQSIAIDNLGNYYVAGYYLNGAAYNTYLTKLPVDGSGIGAYTNFSYLSFDGTDTAGSLTDGAGSLTAATQTLTDAASTATDAAASTTATNVIIPATIGNGGLVWLKGRSGATDHALYDTARGATFDLVSNSTAAQTTQTTGLTSFDGGGFSIGALAKLNTNAATYASWTFRKQAKFFDVVTWTGNGTLPRIISHNLGSVPGCIIAKRTDIAADWYVYHRSLNGGTNPEQYWMLLNTTGATVGPGSIWGSPSIAPTSTGFSVGAALNTLPGSGITPTYVAYVFAHDAGGFGAAGTDNVISCGSYTGTGTSGNFVSLGYEPQWLLIKRTDAAPYNWFLLDNMRGIATGSGNDLYLNPNLSDAEGSATQIVAASAAGFTLEGPSTGLNASGGTYIYIAIRRGPMKTPTSGTSVFGLNARTGTGANATVTGGQTDDAILVKNRGSAVASLFSSRLTSTGYLVTSSTAAEVAAGTTILQANPWDVMDGVKVGTTSTITNASSNTFINYLFRRAPGFFDEVCYTGTGISSSINHNLGAVPELMIFKSRSAAGDWVVCVPSLSIITGGFLNSTSALTGGSPAWTGIGVFNAQQPTSSVIYLSSGGTVSVNASGATYVGYLFATVAGVSKVGSYTGTGTTKQIDCGFTGGARFVLIKRTDSTGDWYVWDSARGIVAGNDPYLLLNSTAAEVTGTDYVDTYSAGFEISSTAPAAINANGGSFIFLAIA